MRFLTVPAEAVAHAQCEDNERYQRTSLLLLTRSRAASATVFEGLT